MREPHVKQSLQVYTTPTGWENTAYANIFMPFIPRTATEAVVGNIPNFRMKVHGSLISAEQVDVKILLTAYLVYPACGVNAVGKSYKKNPQVYFLSLSPS
jgi:hypothetical protein